MLIKFNSVKQKAFKRKSKHTDVLSKLIYASAVPLWGNYNGLQRRWGEKLTRANNRYWRLLKVTPTLRGKEERGDFSLCSHTIQSCVIVCGGLRERWPALLSARLSAVIITLPLTAKMETEDYDEGEIKGQSNGPGIWQHGGGTLCVAVPEWHHIRVKVHIHLAALA